MYSLFEKNVSLDIIFTISSKNKGSYFLGLNLNLAVKIVKLSEK